MTFQTLARWTGTALIIAGLQADRPWITVFGLALLMLGMWRGPGGTLRQY